MQTLQEAFQHHFGLDRVQFIPGNETDIDTCTIQSKERKGVTFYTTVGLSNYTQPATEKNKAVNHVELVFCLPSYWDLNDPNPKMQWVKTWLQKLAKHLIEKETWYGEGHTFPNGNPIEPISETMKQKYLMLVSPAQFENELTPLTFNDKTVHFFCIMPLFEDEFDYKMSKGTFKLRKKLNDRGVSELLDDFRMTGLKNKWRIFR